MEPKIQNLYKVFERSISRNIYVAAESQQEAVDKVAIEYELENKYQLSVDYVSEVVI